MLGGEKPPFPILLLGQGRWGSEWVPFPAPPGVPFPANNNFHSPPRAAAIGTGAPLSWLGGCQILLEVKLCREGRTRESQFKWEFIWTQKSNPFDIGKGDLQARLPLDCIEGPIYNCKKSLSYYLSTLWGITGRFICVFDSFDQVVWLDYSLWGKTMFTSLWGQSNYSWNP